MIIIIIIKDDYRITLITVSIENAGRGYDGQSHFSTNSFRCYPSPLFLTVSWHPHHSETKKSETLVNSLDNRFSSLPIPKSIDHPLEQQLNELNHVEKL